MRPQAARPIANRGRDRSRLHTNELQLGRQHKPDYWLLIFSAILLATGLVVVYAISPALAVANHVSNTYYVGKQLLAIGLSIVAFIATAQIPLRWWRQAYKPLLILAGFATLLALVLPVNPAYPAHRWVRLGSGLSFQSVELVKFAVLIALAGFLAERIGAKLLSDRERTFKPLLIAMAVTGVIIAGPQKLHAQSDLGSMGVMIAMGATMAFIAGLPMRRLVLFAGILAIGVALVILPSGYRACQALISVGSGGIAGQGLGSGAQAYGYLPEAANDSIFAIFAEKFGFIGCTILLGVFVGFFSRLKSIAERSVDDFSRLLVIGVLAWWSVQALINIGAMIGLLPLKGITLPFISYGGTSVVFIAAAVGLVFQVSRYTALSVPRATELATQPRSLQAYRRADT
jgi:cell division protein FtsW